MVFLGCNFFIILLRVAQHDGKTLLSSFGKLMGGEKKFQGFVFTLHAGFWDKDFLGEEFPFFPERRTKKV